MATILSDREPPRVVASIVHRPDGAFEGTVGYIDSGGQVRGNRQLLSRSTDCHEIASALAASISVLLDPRSLLRAPPPDAVLDPFREPAVLPTSPLAPPNTETVDTRAQVPHPAERRLAVRAALGSILGIGSAPAPSFGLVASIGVGRTACR